MQAGRLREVITIERKTTARGSSGEVIPTWALLFSCRANIQPLTGSDAVEAKKLTPTASLTVKVRWADEIKDLTGNDRIVWENKILHIEGTPINVGFRNSEYTILCSDKGKTKV